MRRFNDGIAIKPPFQVKATAICCRIPPLHSALPGTVADTDILR
jgi:hypothetical protein